MSPSKLMTSPSKLFRHTSSSNSNSMDSSSAAPFETTTPKAYKWRHQTCDEGDDRSVYSQHSVSPTDVRLLFHSSTSNNNNNRPLPHADGSIASASLSASVHSSSATTTTTFNNNNGGAANATTRSLSISSSFATAPQTEDDLSSIDDSSGPSPSTYCQQNQYPQTLLTYETALPPLDSDENNSDLEFDDDNNDNFGDRDDDDDDGKNILTRSRFGKVKFLKQRRTSTTATTTPAMTTPLKSQSNRTTPRDKKNKNSMDASSSSSVSNLIHNINSNTATSSSKPQHPPMTPQHEEQHPSKRTEVEIDEHPSKKREPNFQQPPACYTVLKQWASSNDSANNTATPPPPHESPSELEIGEDSFITAPQGDITFTEAVDDNNNIVKANTILSEDITPIKQQQSKNVSGLVCSGHWVFLDEDDKDDHMNLSLLETTSPNSNNSELAESPEQDNDVKVMDADDDDDSPSSVVRMLNTSYDASAGSKSTDILVEQRDISFESVVVTGNWKRDLRATRLEFGDKVGSSGDNAVAAEKNNHRGKSRVGEQITIVVQPRHEDTMEQPKLTSQTSGGILKARSADSDDDHEILIGARRSKPVVLKGDMKDSMKEADLVFQSNQRLSSALPRGMAKDEGEMKVQSRKSKPVVLQGNLRQYMGNANLLFRSKDDLAILPQQRQISRMEILVEPRSEADLHQTWSGDVKEVLPRNDTDKEIDVRARQLRPVVLRGNLKDCVDKTDLIFQSKDDLNALPRFQKSRFPSSMDITVEPLDVEVRRVLGENIAEVMPLHDDSNDMQAGYRPSKSCKQHTIDASLIFRSRDYLAFQDKGLEDDSLIENQVTFEPQEAERVAVSGDLQDYVQNAAQAFHHSIRESTLVFHDTIEPTLSEMDGDDTMEDEARDAYIVDTDSIVSLQEELAVADRSFDLDQSLMSTKSDEVTVPRKHTRSYPVSPEEAVIKRRAKVVTLPFPWCTPELWFVPHNELKPPPGAVNYELPTPPINEEEELSERGDTDTESTGGESNVDQQAASLVKTADFERSHPVENEENHVAVSPDDVAMLYRGNDPPDFQRSKRSTSFLATLVRSFSSMHPSICESFCVDCGGTVTKCGCEATVENDLRRTARMKSVYSIDVGKIVSDPLAKFILIRAPTAKKKKRKRRRKKTPLQTVLSTPVDSAKDAGTKDQVAEARPETDVVTPSNLSNLRNAPEPEPPDPPALATSENLVDDPSDSNSLPRPENLVDAPPSSIVSPEPDDLVDESPDSQVSPIPESLLEELPDSTVSPKSDNLADMDETVQPLPSDLSVDTAWVDLELANSSAKPPALNLVDEVPGGEVSVTTDSLLHEPTDSESQASENLVIKNETVPHPPGDLNVDSASEKQMDELDSESITDGTAKMPLLSEEVKNAALKDPSESYADNSTLSISSSSDLGSIKVLKIGKKSSATASRTDTSKKEGKKAKPIASSIEDPPPKLQKKKNGKKMFRGIRKRVGSLMKCLKGSRASC